MSGLSRRRPSRRLPGFPAPALDVSKGSAQRNDGPMGTSISAARQSRSRPRLGARGGALVVPMAQGERYRDHERTHAARLPGEHDRGGSLAARRAGALGSGANMAVAADRDGGVLHERGWSRAGARSRYRAIVQVAGNAWLDE